MKITHLRMLKGGSLPSCRPEAKRMIARWRSAYPQSEASQADAGDKAYDSAELRDELDERGTKPVIQMAATETTVSLAAALQASLAHRDAFNRLRYSGASQPVTRGPREILARASASVSAWNGPRNRPAALLSSRRCSDPSRPGRAPR